MGDYCAWDTIVAQISWSGFWIHVHYIEIKCCLCVITVQALDVAQPLSAFMRVPHSGYSPTHGSLSWPPLNPSPARSCCFAAGLNTAHCVSAPSRPQTVPTNVLLIRWLNYSCKNNVDISLKIALCQILLAVIGPQPLLSNSPFWTPLHHQQHHRPPSPCLILAPPMLFLTLLTFFPLHISFSLSCHKLKNRRTMRGQIFHK